MICSSLYLFPFILSSLFKDLPHLNSYLYPWPTFPHQRQAALVASGPAFHGLAVEGSAVRLSFDHVGTGLLIGVPPPHFHPGEPRRAAVALQGFSLAGPDGRFHWADARIEGDTVILSSPAVSVPRQVRYAWADNPECNLYNKEGLPAVPFRATAP